MIDAELYDALDAYSQRLKVLSEQAATNNDEAICDEIDEVLAVPDLTETTLLRDIDAVLSGMLNAKGKPRKRRKAKDETCLVPNCSRPVESLLMCRTHYQRYTKKKPLTSPLRPIKKQGQILSVEIGEKFGELLVLEFVGIQRSMTRYRCLCTCGNETIATGWRLKQGIKTCCGCKSKERYRIAVTKHGQSGTLAYASWQGMKLRCYSESDPAYPLYGKRGIVICDRWLESFSNFYADMGARPKGLTIERRDNNGNYEPDNCYWATPTEQQRNTRQNVNITIWGTTLCATAWSDFSGISAPTIIGRIKRGKWDAVSAVFAPMHSKKGMYSI